uniref:FGENESH: predicted gene_16.2 protein n=1 Tax=Rhodotorula toruloides TaxID=5286 RepID=A0A0K3CRI9_RHOTO
MRPTLALALATAASLTCPVLASSHGHASHGQGLVKRHAFGEGGMVRRMVRRVRRGEGAAVLSLPSKSSASSTSSSTNADAKKQYTSTAIWWAEAGWIGSCGEVISDTDPVLALPLSLYPTPSTPSPLCGTSLLLHAPSTGHSITARVVGASDRDDYTAMSRSAFQALGGDLEGGEVGVVMEFVEGDVEIPSSSGGGAASSAVQSGAGKVVAAASSSANSPAAAAQTTTTQAAKTSPSSPVQTTTQAPTTPAQAKQTTTTTTTSSWDSVSAASASAASKKSADAAWASSSSAAAAAAAAASKSSADSAWASSSSAAAYKMWASSSSSAAAAAVSKSAADAAWASSSSAAAAAASKSSADAAWASSSSAAAAAKATQTSSSGSSGGSSGGSGGKVYTGGIATFFYQNGVAGNCGQVNSDDSYIVALPTSTYAGGSHCGQSVKITRSDTGQSITAKVADSCPTCNNASCLDLSVGAYKALGGTDSMGVFDITWDTLATASYAYSDCLTATHAAPTRPVCSADPSTPLTLHVVARPSVLDKLRKHAEPVKLEDVASTDPSAVVASAEVAAAEPAVVAGSSDQAAGTGDVSAAITPQTSGQPGSTVPVPEELHYSPAYIVPPPSLPEPVASTSTIPAATSTPPTPPAAPSTIPVSPYTTYISHLQRLLPLQRALLLLNLQKAHAHYTRLLTAPSTSTGEGVEDVERMLKEVGVWRIVEEKVALREAEWRKVYGDDAGAEEIGRAEQEFRIVQVGGLPYLLHTPPDPQRRTSRPPLAAVLAHTRTETIQHCLTTMLQLLLTMSPGVPALAYGRATTSRSGAPPVAAPGANPNAPDALAAARLAQLGFLNAPPGAIGRPMHPLAQGAQIRRRATLSVIINLDVILSFLIPLFLLSLKLGFLLWIFGRHASPTKRMILGAMAALWVVWEGIGIRRRRVQRERERERLERERRRALRAAARTHQAQQQAQQAQQQQGDGQAGQAQPDLAPPPQQPGAPPAPQPPAALARRARHPANAHDRARRHRELPSRLSPKYWINLIAAVGLVAEARELGLSPRFIAGRPIAPAPPPPRTAAEKRYEALKRVVRNVGVAVVLFVGTLSPEVERKRKRALEKRERLLAERRVAAAAAAARAFLDRPPVLSPAPGPSEQGPEGLRRRATGAHGRGAVSDEQLFQDGGSDAYQSQRGIPSASAPSSADPSHSHNAAASTSAHTRGSQAAPTASTSTAPALPSDTAPPSSPDLPPSPQNVLADSDGGADGEDAAEDDDVASATSGDGATTSDDEERLETRSARARKMPGVRHYLDLHHLRRLDEYAYSAVDKSPVSQYIMRHWWTWTASFAPPWLAPNAITVIGFCAILLNTATVALVAGDLRGSENGWVWASCAAGLFFYQTMDNIDGKQARRTGTSSPMGELFDHGLDTLNCPLGAVIQASALALGPSPLALLCILVPCWSMYVSTWEEYHTGTLYLGFVSGPVEGILLAVLILTWTGIKGSSWWLLTVSEALGDVAVLPTSWRMNQLAVAFFTLAFVATQLPLCLRNVHSQLTSPPRRSLTRPGRHSTTLNPPSPAEAFQQLFPIVGFSVLTVMWVLSPQSVMLQGGGKLVEFALVVCYLFGQLSSKIILAHLTKGLFPFSWPLLIPLAIPAIAVNTPYLGLSVESRFSIWILQADSLARSPSLLPPTLETLYLHLLLALSLLSYTLSAHAVLSSFCGYLGISCLTIPFPNKAVEGWVPLPTVKLHQSPRPPSMGEYGAQEEEETYPPASAPGRAPLALDRSLSVARQAAARRTVALPKARAFHVDNVINNTTPFDQTNGTKLALYMIGFFGGGFAIPFVAAAFQIHKASA